MAHYTPLTSQQIHHLSQRYNLTVKNYTPMAGGAANTSFLLNTAKGRYILTIADDKPYPDVLEMASLLDHLARHKFPASRLVVAANGEKVTRFYEKAVLVKKFIPGEAKFKISENGLFDLGQALAQLHAVPCPDSIRQALPYGQNFFTRAYGLGFDPEYEAWLACQQENFLRQCPDDLPCSLIHGDVFWDNIIYLEGVFQALIDFEDACYYFSIYDIANAISGACVEADGMLNFEKAARMVAGYQEIRPLTPAEQNSLQLFTHYSVVAISFWRYLKYNLYNPIEEKNSLHREKMALAEYIQSIPQKTFRQILNQ